MLVSTATGGLEAYVGGMGAKKVSKGLPTNREAKNKRGTHAIGACENGVTPQFGVCLFHPKWVPGDSRTFELLASSMQFF